MHRGEKIGEGNHRECYAIQGTDMCAKRLKPYTATIRSLIAHTIRDIHQEELDVLNQIPEELQPFFLKAQRKDREWLLMQRPKDYDGGYAKTLGKYQTIHNDHFWELIDHIAQSMIKHKLWLFDIFHCGNNILVHKQSEDKYVPIVIDCKRSGWKAYPLQINLLLDSQKEKKMARRLKRCKEKFKGKE